MSALGNEDDPRLDKIADLEAELERVRAERDTAREGRTQSLLRNRAWFMVAMVLLAGMAISLAFSYQNSKRVASINKVVAYQFKSGTASFCRFRVVWLQQSGIGDLIVKSSRTGAPITDEQLAQFDTTNRQLHDVIAGKICPVPKP